MRQFNKQLQRLLFWTKAETVGFAIAMAAAFAVASDEGSQKGKEVRVALPISTMRGMDPVDAQLTMDKIFDFVGVSEVKFKSKVYRTTEEVYQAVIAEEADMIPMLIEEFLERPDDCKMEPVLQGVTDEVAGEQLVMLALKDVGLAGMKGKKVIVDAGQQMPRIWLDLLLADEGLPNHSTFFSSVKDELRSSDAVLPVFFGEAVACITSEAVFEMLAELNPQLRQRLHVVAKSVPYAMHVICLRSNYVGEMRERIIADMSMIHESSNGRQVLLLTKINRVDRSDPKLVDAARDMMERWKLLQSSPVTSELESKETGQAVAETGVEGAEQ